MKIKNDIFGNISKEGDIIVFNPPSFKGLSYGTCIGFTDAGCTKLNNIENGGYNINFDLKKKGFYSVKTEFVIKK